jgi:2-polyprenyl-3-methyl-5-hydroxy-6-metoxy-1,4-benzoquinol methylase
MDTLDPLRYGTEPQSLGGSHAAMLELITPGQTVLEVGCSAGAMTQALVDRDCTVVGIEIDPVAAERARAFAQRVLVTDVETVDLAELLGEERFDVVLFGDVLEHLRDPVAVLRSSLSVLADDGYAVLSIPNVAHGDVRLSLFRGEFQYRPVGLLDVTHIRFFTIDTIEELLSEADCIAALINRVEVPLFGTELELDPTDYPPDVVERVDAEPEAHTYQFVIKAVPTDRDDGLRELRDRAERSRIDLERLRRRNERLESVVEELERECDSLRIDVVTARLEREAAVAERDQSRAEVEALYATRLLRSAAPLRRLYAQLRGRPPIA